MDVGGVVGFGEGFGFAADLHAAAADVSNAQGEDAFGGHHFEGFGAGEFAEELAMLGHGEAVGDFKGGPEAVLGTGGLLVGGANNDVAGEGIFFPHEVEGDVEVFGGDFPGDESAMGEVDGHEGLADATDGAGTEHGGNTLVDGGEIDVAEGGDVGEGGSGEALDFVFGDGEDLGVEGVGGFDGE